MLKFIYTAKQNCTTEMQRHESCDVLVLTEMFVFLRWEWICKLTCVYSRGSEAIRKYKHIRKDRLRTNPFYQKLTYSHIPRYNMQRRQNVQNSLSRFMFYTGLYVLAAFVVLVINLTYVDGFCSFFRSSFP